MNYSPLIYHYFNNQQYVGEFPHSEQGILSAENGTPGISDVVKISFKLDSKHTILDAKFKAYGNPYTIAILAWICETMVNKPIAQLSEITYRAIIDLFELPEHKIKSAILIEDLLKKIPLQNQPLN